ncbi:MAG: GTPase ObgE [candidate division Zixibacteria bacterium RBG_16_43_9]|nr:MAG: GTPase ObgE [candidate division Zixibacteria bacterium RBG_16_43_9]
MFVDYAEIEVWGGKGGNGCVSFRREKYLPKGGPNGGDGGKGGDLILKVDPDLSTLLDFHYKRIYKAGNGKHGEGKDRTGEDGKDLMVKVPPGTVVKDKESGEVLGDLVSSENLFIAAKGGRGGKGNAHFKSSTNQAPRFAQSGEKGQMREIILELKLLADVGIVGPPNAGKSTLLARVSDARPKVAPYPFTTLKPNLGVVRLKSNKSFVLADIPGLIEGAHKGKGLGLDFLRHIQRTKILVFLLDVTVPDIPLEYNRLKQELKLYDLSLLEKPAILAVNKIDLLTDEEKKKIKVNLDMPSVKISALTGVGIKELLNIISRKLEKGKLQEKEEIKIGAF